MVAPLGLASGLHTEKEPAIGDGSQVGEEPQDMLIRARVVLRGSHTDGKC
jgi:hypothetical protein